jgi:hypothetical protein
MKAGEIYGLCVDCMAECKIVKCNEDGTCVMEAIIIHAPNPQNTFFGKNKNFIATKKDLKIKLGESEKDFKKKLRKNNAK